MSSQTMKFVTLIFFGCSLVACQGSREVTSREYSGNARQSLSPDTRPGILGDDGVSMNIGGKHPEQDRSARTGIGVNAYLWRAALDTLSFMPLQSADPFGGVIITGWWQTRTNPNEQFKVTVYILSSALRSENLKMAIFRQTEHNGQWTNDSVDSKLITSMENKILLHAIELRTLASAS